MCTKHPDIVVHCTAKWSPDLSWGWMDFNAELTKNFCLCKLWQGFTTSGAGKISSNPEILEKRLNVWLSIFSSVTQLNVISERQGSSLSTDQRTPHLLLNPSQAWPSQFFCCEIFLGHKIEKDCLRGLPNPAWLRGFPEELIRKETEFCSFRIPPRCILNSC